MIASRTTLASHKRTTILQTTASNHPHEYCLHPTVPPWLQEPWQCIPIQARGVIFFTPLFGRALVLLYRQPAKSEHNSLCGVCGATTCGVKVHSGAARECKDEITTLKEDSGIHQYRRYRAGGFPNSKTGGVEVDSLPTCRPTLGVRASDSYRRRRWWCHAGENDDGR